MNIKNKLITNQYEVDTTNNQITFLDTRVYRSPVTGAFLPSVTTILDAYPKPASFFKWLKENGDSADEIRDEAGRVGSIVHNYTEAYDNGETVSLFNTDGTISIGIKEWKCFERYVEFSQRIKPEILLNEVNFISDKLGFAGTLDRVMIINGKTYLIDIKTSNSIHKHYFVQMAAYVKLIEEFHPDLKIDGIGILWLNALTRTDGKGDAIQGKGWQLVEPKESIDYYWKLFTHAHALHIEERGDEKPNNLTYKLTHAK